MRLQIGSAVWPGELYANLPLDLIEALRRMAAGDKLPPLPWWMVEVTYTEHCCDGEGRHYRVLGVDTADYALAALVVICALVAVWKTAQSFVGAVGVAILIIDGMHYFDLTAVKFNRQCHSGRSDLLSGQFGGYLSSWPRRDTSNAASLAE